MKRVPLALLFWLSTVFGQSQSYSSVSAGEPTSTMTLGPDGYLYLGSGQANMPGHLTKIDWQTRTVVWSVELGQAEAIRPTAICFHPERGIVVMLGPNVAAATILRDGYRWATLSPDGTNIAYHVFLVPLDAPPWWDTVHFGGGGCAVTSDGTLYFSSDNGDPHGTRHPAVITIDANNRTDVVFSTDMPVPYLIAAKGDIVAASVSTLKAPGLNQGAVVLIKGKAVTAKIPLNIVPAQSMLGPDGQTLYIGGNNCGMTCPDPAWYGLDIVDTQSQEPLYVNLKFIPGLAWSGSDTWLMYANAVRKVVPSTWQPYGKMYFNPDGSNTNRQLFARRGPQADILALRTKDNVLFWDVANEASFDALVNAASFKTGAAPGSFVTVFGQNLADREEAAGPFIAYALAGGSVSVDGKPARLFYFGRGQVNLGLPQTLAAGNHTMTVLTADNKSLSREFTVSAAAPALFTFLDGQFAGKPFVVSVQGSLVGDPAAWNGFTPAKIGDAVSFYGTGCGTVTPAVNEGEISPGGLHYCDTVPFLSLCGTPVTPLYAGRAPGTASEDQINALVPASCKAGANDVIYGSITYKGALWVE